MTAAQKQADKDLVTMRAECALLGRGLKRGYYWSPVHGRTIARFVVTHQGATISLKTLADVAAYLAEIGAAAV